MESIEKNSSAKDLNIKTVQTQQPPETAKQPPETIPAPETSQTPETPQNGLAGLKHWRQDIPAALVVALVSVPLSLGIALASGAPPICGLTSEIIAGLIFPLIGGAYVTISGPAAGLAPVLFSAITALGHGDMQSGYRLVLAVIMITGLLQIVLTKLNAARFSQLFPTAAIHGMLAAIGFLLMAKQLPYFLGCKFSSHEFFGMISELPAHFSADLSPNAFSIAIICLLSLFLFSSEQLRGGLFRLVPPQLLVVLIGATLANVFHVDSKLLVQMPNNPLEHGIVFPDFAGLIANPTLIPTAIVFVLALTFVDGTESLATVQAVDRIDPFHRKSCPNRTLFAMGVSNICSSLFGGLTIIPGIIKSTTCVVSGGRTAWVNFYNALFLLAILLCASGLIKMIPMATLAAILAHIGYKLAGPHKWRSVASAGMDQVIIFTVTIVGTLASDLLVGIAAGMLTKLIILFYFSYKSSFFTTSTQGGLAEVWNSFALIFRSPIEHVEVENGILNLHVTGALNCFNGLPLRSVLSARSQDIKLVVLHFSPAVRLIDHSTSMYLNATREELKRAGKDLECRGLAELRPSSRDRSSLKYRTMPSMRLRQAESTLIGV
jgi:carbonic anhydrase